jgi:uncharacterized damage-inducible protein DinB
MTSAELIADAFGRIREAVHDAVEGLTSDQLSFRVDSEANSICWLVWHLTRVQDDHVAGVSGAAQLWIADGWSARFGLPLDIGDTGYGHRTSQVVLVRSSAELLLGYHDAVHQSTLDFVQQLTDADLDRIVDERFDPPVSLGVRLVSVITDDLQHAGQAAFVRGVVERR